MNKKIKAFTILEIVISLAIMSIIISMVYAIYTLMGRHLYEYSSQTDAINEYNQLDAIFRRDLHQAIDLKFHDEILYLYSNKDTIRYFQNTNQLVRMNAQKIDAFQTKINDFYIDKERLLLQNPIQKISIQYNLLEQSIDGVYFKNFGVARQINNEFF